MVSRSDFTLVLRLSKKKSGDESKMQHLRETQAEVT